MSDKFSFVPDSVAEAVNKTNKVIGNEVKAQILGPDQSEVKKQEEATKKLTEKAEESGRTVEEETELAQVRRRLHQEVIALRPTPTEQPVEEEDDKVGTNETMQPLNGAPGQNSNSFLQPIPSHRRGGEMLKVRE